MSNGFETAKGQRNFLERLGDKIPGYRGFQNRELRRDVDRMQREHLASEVGRLKGQLEGKVREVTDAGRLGSLGGFVRVERELDGLSQTIRFSDYGASGLFDPVKISEPELERLYQFDLSVLDDLAAIERAIAALPAPSPNAPAAPATGEGSSLAAALETLRGLVHGLDDKWKQRREVIGNVVGSASGAKGAPGA
jgi:hypothetical protein